MAWSLEHGLQVPKTEVQIPAPQAGDLGQSTVSPRYGPQSKMGILYSWPGIPVRMNRDLQLSPLRRSERTVHGGQERPRTLQMRRKRANVSHAPWRPSKTANSDEASQTQIRLLPFGHFLHTNVVTASKTTSAAEYLWRHPTSQGRHVSYIHTKENPANSKLH